MLSYYAGAEETQWSKHLHPLVWSLLAEEGHLFTNCNAEVARLLALVTKRKSMWTNAKQQLAWKMQQNMEVSVRATRVPPCDAPWECYPSTIQVHITTRLINIEYDTALTLEHVASLLVFPSRNTFIEWV